MYEAVFRYQFENNTSGGQANVDYYFLTLGQGDPTQEFLARFGGHSPKIEPASAARVSESDGVSHEEHGGRGLIFDVTRIRWIDDDTVDVVGGYYKAELSASGNRYRVQRRGGEWVVTNNTLLVIS